MGNKVLRVAYGGLIAYGCKIGMCTVHFAQFVGTVVPCNHFLTHSAKLSPQAAHSGGKYFLKENHIVIHLHFHQLFIYHLNLRIEELL